MKKLSKRSRIILMVIICLLGLSFLIWHYRFLFRETVHLNYSAEWVSRVRILICPGTYDELQRSKVEKIENRTLYDYDLLTASEIKEVLEKINSLNLKKLEYYTSNDFFIVDDLTDNKPEIYFTLYDNKDKLLGSINVCGYYVYITDGRSDRSIADYMMAEEYYRGETQFPFEEYFVKDE